MAKAFEANTMNCSRLTARTAGTESTAKITSVVSMSTSTANSGVASSLPRPAGEELLAVVARSVDGTTLRTSRSTGLCSGWTVLVLLAAPGGRR